MHSGRKITVDGNEAAASVAYRASEVIAIYPITPASTMGELSDEWSALGKPNVWGGVPDVVEMQSEAGAAGTVHGALTAGALTTTFTASQGLLLMIPNLYKIAGELTPFCLHVAARTLATHALSIFGDHSDVMACRQTGMAMLAAGSVQEAHDFALIAHASTLLCRIPFLHFFDGFRTSHEVAKIEQLDDDDIRAMLDPDAIAAHRARALTPDHPSLRGAAENPDTFFQATEAQNRFHLACPSIVQRCMDRFAEQTGRRYRLFDYHGHPEADRVVVLAGSGAEVAHEMVDWMVARGERVGVLKVRLFRPFSVEAFAGALPKTVRTIAVLDRTKEPGSVGEPLYLDVLAALREAEETACARPASMPRVVGGRYGLSSKEFDPAMVKAIFDELSRPAPKNHFTIGIIDDVTHTSLAWDRELDIEPENVVRAVFFGIGSDGTVGSNKNSIKIIGEDTDGYAQGYFVYDSKKAGAITISHLRFGPDAIRSSYLVKQAGFVACHDPQLLERQDVLRCAAPGATFLLNAPWKPEEVWDHLPREVQQTIVDKKLQTHVIDGYGVAARTGMGRHIGTIMQACFFAVSGVLPREQAIVQIKRTIEKSYGKRGPEVVRRNFEAVDAALAGLRQVPVPTRVTSTRGRQPVVSPNAPDQVKRLSAVMMEGHGDWLPVSAFPVDGTWPTGTAQWEKRNLALEIPVWDPAVCIQCNKCTLICPHAAIRAKVYEPAHLRSAPATFLAVDYKAAEFKGDKYSLQVAPEDCTGCGLCVAFCPAKDKANPAHKAINMASHADHLEQERPNYAFFLGLPEADRQRVHLDVKGSQFFLPLLEYSGACSGCGETPYVKLLTQLFGDRLLIANATGCSSIFGGNLPTTPYTTDASGRGPAWANSLFEDNAEFGLGFRLAVDSHERRARALLAALANEVGGTFVDALLGGCKEGEAETATQRQRVTELRRRLQSIGGAKAQELAAVADALVKKSVWIVGGDGWAYDIGYGGLDHVLASNRKVNLLVLDTEVYSNTGGQQSKATPLGATAKFASGGKATAKKDLGMLAMTYANAYVASIAMGARDTQTVRALLEAEAYPGPSLIIAYSHCIAHGYDLVHGADQQRLAVESGAWPLYRYDPRRLGTGEAPLKLDSGTPKATIREYMMNEGRFRMVEKKDPKRFERLMAEAEAAARQRRAMYEHLAGLKGAPVAAAAGKA
jgi:pyruvate-ferredoxin/flavodoxin oxidoreductase